MSYRTYRNPAVLVPLLLLVATASLAVAPLAEYRPNYADAYGQVLPPELVDYVLELSRIPEGLPSLEEYREFARSFYRECEVRVDMALLLLYGFERVVGHGGRWYVPFFAVVYDPLTGRVLHAFLNHSAALPIVWWSSDYTKNPFLRGMRPIGYQMWLVEVDAEAFARGSLVVLVYYYRWNETHVHNPGALYNGRPLRPYCPLPEGFDYSLYFRGLPETVTVTQTRTVTETYTPPPVTVTLTQTTTAYYTTTETLTMPPATVTLVETYTLPPITVTEVLTPPPETLTETATVTSTVTETVVLTSTATATEVRVEVRTVTITATPVVQQHGWLDWSVMVSAALFAGVAVGLVLGRFLGRR